jgi:hypothetical protein
MPFTEPFTEPHERLRSPTCCAKEDPIEGTDLNRLAPRVRRKPRPPRAQGSPIARAPRGAR